MWAGASPTGLKPWKTPGGMTTRTGLVSPATTSITAPRVGESGRSSNRAMRAAPATTAKWSVCRAWQCQALTTPGRAVVT